MKLDMEQWDKSLGDLYQTVLQPALLTPALTGINAMMDSDFCHLFGITSAGEESFTIVTNKGGLKYQVQHRVNESNRLVIAI